MCSKNITNDRSSFSGKIDEIPGIYVDNFNIINKRAYFLSHCHTDHTEGLYKEELLDFLEGNKNTYIYMSDASAHIVEHENNKLKSYLKVLSLGEPTVVELRAVPEENLEECIITVTAVPAGHCLGSIMFLFQTTRKTILYTGDFRISLNDVKKYREFHKPSDRTEPIGVDAMYIDTTFYNKNYDDFMKRKDAIDYLIKEIKDWLNKDRNNQIALSISAKYGYEKVFNDIYKKLQVKVYVGDSIWKLYRKMPDKVIGVTNDATNTRIHVCYNKWPRHSHANCVKTNTEANYLFVRLSAMTWKNYTSEDAPFEMCERDKRLNVCFSTHCSRNELVYFISYFAPKKVVGFPNPYMGCEKALVIKENVSDFTFPPRKRFRR
ncbi:protein artemis-like [Achroia grisella]|uniref:protein artemis-like n=1 Tax=Achroia grisella TaxID=688607 RepID=UPI0027D28392|nr:protein artemis-like [Achroia grisella]